MPELEAILGRLKVSFYS